MRGDPGAEVLFGEEACVLLFYVSGEDEGGVLRAVVLRPEGEHLLAGDGLDAVDGAGVGEAVGLVAVEQARADAQGDGRGLVALLLDRDHALAANAFEVGRVEGRVEDDVGEQGEGGVRCCW